MRKSTLLFFRIVKSIFIHLFLTRDRRAQLRLFITNTVVASDFFHTSGEKKLKFLHDGQMYLDECNFFSKKEKKIDFKAEPLMFLDLASHMKSLYFTLKQYLHKVERTVPSLVSILKLFVNGHFLKAVIDRASVLPLLIFSSGSQSKRKN